MASLAGVQEKTRFVEAAVLLAATRVITRLSPRVATARLLRIAGVARSTGCPIAGQAAHVTSAIDRVAAWVDGSTCLNRALTGWLMLRRRGIDSVVRVGARRVQAGRLDVHAWLEVGGEPVTGRAEAAGFVPLCR